MGAGAEASWSASVRGEGERSALVSSAALEPEGEAESPFAPPREPSRAEPPFIATQRPRRRPAERAYRIAGGVLVLSALFGLIFPFVLPADDWTMINVAPALIDLLLGAALLAGDDRLAGLVRLRVAVGAVLWTGVSLAESDPWAAGLQLLFSAGLLLLLVGRPSRGRMWGGVAAVSPCILLAAFALSLRPDADLEAPARADLSELTAPRRLEGHPVPGGRVAGPGYALRVPSREWRQVDAGRVFEQNPALDAWIFEPTAENQVQVIAERLDAGVRVKRSALVDLAVANVLRGASESRVLKQVEHGPNVVVHSVATFDGRPFEYRHRIFMEGRVVIQVLAFAPEGALTPGTERMVHDAQLGRAAAY